MDHPIETTYDATRDPRTGRPVLPIDADNTRKAEAESLPLTGEDNQGIEFGDDDAEEDDAAAPSSVEVNSSAPRMKAADPESDELESDNKLIDEDIVEQESMEGERPEALAKFAEVARNGDGKPLRNGTDANAENAPIPMDPAQKQDAATKVLREGVLKHDQGADEAVDRLPDRTAPRHNLPQG